MNYRHAFYAGNHMELFKYTALVLLMCWILVKPEPSMFLGTHAGQNDTNSVLTNAWTKA